MKQRIQLKNNQWNSRGVTNAKTNLKLKSQAIYKPVVQLGKFFKYFSQTKRNQGSKQAEFG